LFFIDLTLVELTSGLPILGFDGIEFSIGLITLGFEL
jgi:hypothetical protein